MAPPLVLVHAFPLSSAMWQPMLSCLPAHIEVVAPDVRGAGMAPLGNDPASVDVLADDVAALLDARGVAHAIVGGLSMGGYVAMAFARRHPERLAGVVLADTKGGADAEAARANRLRIADALVAEGNVRVLRQEVMPGLLGATTWASRPAVADLVGAMIDSTAPEAAAWWQRAMAARPDSFDVLRSLDAPALVIVGEEDALAPVDAEARPMAAALRDGTLVALPGAGHLSALETPQAFAAALGEWVSRLP